MAAEQMAGQAVGAAAGGVQVPPFPSYHVPANSWRPVAASVALFLMMLGAGTMLNQLRAGEPADAKWLLMLGFGGLVLVLFGWFATTISEHLAGMNSARLQTSYVYAMCWFIFTEVMFFAVFFGALFYLRVLVVPWLGGEGDKGISNMLWQGFEATWPLMETPQQAVGGATSQLIANNGVFSGPHQNMSFPGWGNLLHWLPLWNTILLLSSSVTVHIAHLGLKAGNRLQLAVWLGITVALGASFLVLQYLEYHEAYVEYGLTLNSGVYGTTFFMLTGFHGFHVLLGATMLLIMWLRAQLAGHFKPADHFGFEAASWYWHFVDVVWVCLFLFVYIL